MFDAHVRRLSYGESRGPLVSNLGTPSIDWPVKSVLGMLWWVGRKAAVKRSEVKKKVLFGRVL